MNVNERVLLQQAVKELNEMDENGDAEALHGEAEDILCGYLIAIGSKELAEAFDNAQERVGFWYA